MLYDVTYIIEWPNGKIEQKTFIMKGSETFSLFLERIGFRKLLEDKLVKLHIKQIKETLVG